LDEQTIDLVVEILTKYSYDFVAPSGLPVTMLMSSSRDYIIEVMESLRSV